MKLYNSFLVRCWLTRDSLQDQRRVLQVEQDKCINGVQMIRRSELVDLMDAYEQVWHW